MLVDCVDIDATEIIIGKVKFNLYSNFESRFKGLVRSIHSLEHTCQMLQRKRRPNLVASIMLLT